MCLNASAHTSSQASLDPLLVGSLFASVAGMPRLGSVRLPAGCRGGNLCGFLDHDASMLVKTPPSTATFVETSSLSLLAHECLVCSRAWDACATHILAFASVHRVFIEKYFSLSLKYLELVIGMCRVRALLPKSSRFFYYICTILSYFCLFDIAQSIAPQCTYASCGSNLRSVYIEYIWVL